LGGNLRGNFLWNCWGNLEGLFHFFWRWPERGVCIVTLCVVGDVLLVLAWWMWEISISGCDTRYE
jgi:hypothetical protein